MNEREPLGKKLRFEVFKRDKFTCQYCGRKAPDVVLNADHINPVAAGGDNSVINLVTSCFECNSGKSDRLLDDNTVVEKQRKQLELLQERREQIEMMFEWKKSLQEFDSDVEEMVAGYVNSKMPPLVLSETGKRNIPNWLKRFSVEQILDGIDGAAKTYLHRDNDGNTEQESAKVFLSKIGGVIAVNQMSPIKKKLAYIKGIARNRFGYWDDRKGGAILGAYIKAIEDHGWDENRILEDLEQEVIPKTKEAQNWTEWRNLLEGWTDDVKQWQKAKAEKSADTVSDLAKESLETGANYNLGCYMDALEVAIYLGKPFPDFDEKKFAQAFILSTHTFVQQLRELYDSVPGQRIEADENFVNSFFYDSGIMEHFAFENADLNGKSYGFLYQLYETASHVLESSLSTFYLPRTTYSRSNIDYLLSKYTGFFGKQVHEVHTTPE